MSSRFDDADPTDPADAADDPVRRFAQRTFPWVAGAVLIGQVVASREALLSGRALPLVSAVVWIGFWAWLFFYARRQARTVDMTDADEVRRAVLRTTMEAGVFLVLFVVLVVWGSVVSGFTWPALLPLLWPGLLVLSGWLGHANAERVAASYRRNAPSRGA